MKSSTLNYLKERERDGFVEEVHLWNPNTQKVKAGRSRSLASLGHMADLSLRTWSRGHGLLKPLAVVFPVKTQPPSQQPTKESPAQRDNKQPWPPADDSHGHLPLA
ncbi:hypothetical protein LEMLEM_LOCUS2986 [Lemmus lemmus]